MNKPNMTTPLRELPVLDCHWKIGPTQNWSRGTIKQVPPDQFLSEIFGPLVKILVPQELVDYIPLQNSPKLSISADSINAKHECQGEVEVADSKRERLKLEFKPTLTFSFNLSRL